MPCYGIVMGRILLSWHRYCKTGYIYSSAVATSFAEGDSANAGYSDAIFLYIILNQLTTPEHIHPNVVIPFLKAQRAEGIWSNIQDLDIHEAMHISPQQVE